MAEVAPEGRQMWRGRQRPRKKHNAGLSDRYQQLIDGRLDIEDLDDEEIFNGKLRDVNGNFTGGAPRVIPWSMHGALRDSIVKRTERQLAEEMPKITAALIKIALKESLNPDARVKAITLIMDRAMGKVAEKTEVSVNVTAKWQEAVKGGRIMVDLEADDDIVEAEVVEEPAQLEVTATKVTRAKTGVRL